MTHKKSIDAQTTAKEENPWKKDHWHPCATTHVANASDHPIWVSCQTDPAEVDRMRDELRSVYREKSLANIIGFTRIEPNKFLAFNPSISPNPQCRVYVTILLDLNGSPETVASAYPMLPNYSVLVSKSHVLRRVQMGKIWVDQDGVDHQSA